MQTTKRFLSSSIPHIEADLAPVGVEGQRVDFNPNGGNVFLFELTSEMALDKRCLPSATISDQDELKCCHNLILQAHGKGPTSAFKAKP